MTRYFMTIPEASQLVLQAAAIAENERVYFLDMGEPVRIVDLAEDLIRLSGLEPYVDIDIQEVGMRPGEKLFEELSTTQAAASTSHRKIFVANGDNLGDADLGELISELSELANAGNQRGIREALQRGVPGGMLSESAPAL
jgi:FlaA1/EpsC-like NDP-sugar epimerase